jgi:hypothetical protein
LGVGREVKTTAPLKAFMAEKRLMMQLAKRTYKWEHGMCCPYTGVVDFQKVLNE